MRDSEDFLASKIASGVSFPARVDAGRLSRLLVLCEGGLAQLVERLVRNEKVRGSNPLTSTTLLVALGYGFYLLKVACSDILADVAEGNL